MLRLNRDWTKTKTSSCACALLLFLAMAVQLSWGQAALPSGAKFEVISVKVLPEQEAINRSPDFIGANVAVRLRLSCTTPGFYFYSWGDDVSPVGYSVQVTGQGLVWRNKMPGHTDSQTSPGIEKLNSFVPGVWRLMSGHVRPAIEWEQLDSTTFAGEKHAFTVFIKKTDKDKPIEIVSDSYIVPTAGTSSK